MNDHSEVLHGARGMYRSLTSDIGSTFYEVIDSCHSNASEEIKSLVSDRMPYMLADTFISCLSEHAPEDNLGRFSMWRAYGGEAGVAIIFRQAPFLSEHISIGAYSYPVMYGGDLSAGEEIQKISNKIQDERDIVKRIPRDIFIELVIQSLRSIAIATKHEAFKEEREWRVVACPTLIKSKYLKQEVRCIGAVAQVVQILDIGQAAADGFAELSPNNLIDRVLIGPTEYSRVLYRSMVELLKEHGVANAHERVHITDIPLRANQR
jgi:hypothetical protein